MLTKEMILDYLMGQDSMRTLDKIANDMFDGQSNMAWDFEPFKNAVRYRLDLLVKEGRVGVEKHRTTGYNGRRGQTQRRNFYYFRSVQ